MRTKTSNFSLLKELLATIPADDSCMVWPRSRNGHGYGQIKMKSKPNQALHRVSYELAVGPIPEGLCVLHKCDNRPCFRPSHLFLGTKQDNSDDCIAKGRARKRHGEAVNTAKLTADQVREIRKLRTDGWTQQALGDKFGVLQTSISRICLRQHWKHVSN